MPTEYIIKLWLLTIISSPFINGIIEAIMPVTPFGLLHFLPAAIIFSLVFSIPTLFVVIVINKAFSSYGLATSHQKIIVLIIVLIGINTTLFFVDIAFAPTMILTYNCAVIISAIYMEVISFIQKKLIS